MFIVVFYFGEYPEVRLLLQGTATDIPFRSSLYPRFIKAYRGFGSDGGTMVGTILRVATRRRLDLNITQSGICLLHLLKLAKVGCTWMLVGTISIHTCFTIQHLLARKPCTL